MHSAATGGLPAAHNVAVEADVLVYRDGGPMNNFAVVTDVSRLSKHAA